MSTKNETETEVVATVTPEIDAALDAWGSVLLRFESTDHQQRIKKRLHVNKVIRDAIVAARLSSEGPSTKQTATAPQDSEECFTSVAHELGRACRTPESR